MEIVKTWYSSFSDTPLHNELQSTATTHLYLAGVTTNTCVAATSVHARRLGYSVTLVSDLVKAIKAESHEIAIQTLTNPHYNIEVCSSDQVAKSLGFGANLPTLYWVNGSIPSWRVMLALAAKQIPYFARRLRVMSKPKETRSAEFVQINPRCKTPTFVDTDGTVVIESLAILQYLEQYYPTPSLLPPATEKVAWTREMVRFNETENPHNLYEPIELLFLPNWQSHREDILQAHRDTLNELGFWEGYLAKDQFVSGRAFGLADCAFYPILAYMVHRGLKLSMAFPALEAYYGICRQHRAVIEACPEKWEEPGKSLFARCKTLQQEQGN
jgi:glutathione S-transferase